MINFACCDKGADYLLAGPGRAGSQLTTADTGTPLGTVLFGKVTFQATLKAYSELPLLIHAESAGGSRSSLDIQYSEDRYGRRSYFAYFCLEGSGHLAFTFLDERFSVNQIRNIYSEHIGGQSIVTLKKEREVIPM